MRGLVQTFFSHVTDASPSLENVTFIDHIKQPAIYDTNSYIDPTTSKFKGLKFINTPWKLYSQYTDNQYTQFAEEGAIIDLDGSITNRNEPTMLTEITSGLLTKDSEYVADFNSAYVPKRDTVMFRIPIENYNFPIIRAIRDDGRVTGLMQFGWALYTEQFNSNRISANTEYSLPWEGKQLSKISFDIWDAKDRFILIGFAYGKPPLSITSNNKNLPTSTSLESLRKELKSGYFYDSSKGTLYLKLWGELELQNFLVKGQEGLSGGNPPFKGRSPSTVQNPSPGLSYQYYANAGTLEPKDLELLNPTLSGTVTHLDKLKSLTSLGKDSVLMVKGFLNIVEPGRFARS